MKLNDILHNCKWLWVINVAVLYNLIVVVGRAVFWELDNLVPVTWMVLDYFCDFLYVVDTFVRMHEGISEFVLCEETCGMTSIYRLSRARFIGEKASFATTKLSP